METSAVPARSSLLMSFLGAGSGKIPLWFHIKEQSSREDILLTQLQFHNSVYQAEVQDFFFFFFFAEISQCS